MSRKPSTQTNPGLVDDFINTAYDTVKLVADNMDVLNQLALLLQDSDFDYILENLEDIIVLVDNITDVITVAGIAPDVVIVANNVSDVVVVSHDIASVKAVAAHIDAVRRVATSADNVDRVSASANNVDIVATSILHVDVVGNEISHVITVSNNINSVTRVSASADNVDIVADNIDAVLAVPMQMEEIRQAVATTTADAQTTTANAADALASKNAAALSEANAAASAVASKTSEDAAKMSELAAYASELGSSASAVEADASESAAKTAEVNSIANATASYNYSELARGYANAAEISKGESQAAAADADNSADESLLSADAAKASELIAKASEVASKASETAAKASETASKASELAAKSSETIASTKATQTAADTVTTAGHVTQTANNAALAEAAKNEAQAAADSLVGGIVDKGAWDASTGVFPEKPTRPLPDGGTALVSAFWKVTGAGTVSGISFLIGDDLRFSAGTDEFYKVDNTDAVASVQGKTGAVTLSASEVGALATPTGTHAVDTVLVAGATAGTSKHSGFTLGKSVPSNAVFTDTVYTHPTNDGNLHVPATGTTNAGKALVAGATAGSVSWKTLISSDISGLDAALNAKLDATANAVSATKLQNTVTINGVAFDGSANITISASNPATLTRGTGLTGANYSGGSATTWAVAYGSAAGTACQGNDARLSDARTPLAHSHVWADITGKPTTLAGYGITDAPTKTGSGASGSWGISVTGNAASATILQTARTINGVSFNGSANITITAAANGGTAYASAVLNRQDTRATNEPPSGYDTTGVTYHFKQNATNGFTQGGGVYNRVLNLDAWSSISGGLSGQMAFGDNGTVGYRPSLDDATWGAWKTFVFTGDNIGTGASNYAAGNHNHSSISGNAATATTLKTARTINGVSFNGSTNITVADSTKLPLSGGTLTNNLTFVGTLGGINFNQSETSVARGMWYNNASGTAQAAIGCHWNGATGEVINFYFGKGSTPWNDKLFGVNNVGDGTFSGYVNAVRFSVTGNAGYFHGDSNYTQFSGSNFYITSSVPITYIYSPSIYLGNTSGTTVLLRGNTIGGTGWNISGTGTITGASIVGPLSGNATTATTLQTARTINGVSFNGSANITITAAANGGTSAACSGNAATATTLQTARTLTIGSTGKSFNGSANVTWSLAEIGAAAASHSHSYLPLSGGTLTGALTGTTASFTTVTGTSDERLKGNVETLDNALETVCALRGVAYTWNSDGKADVGVIAQEVREVVPEVVHEDSNGMLSVDHGHLVGHLIEAIKTLEARVSELEGK